MPSNDEQIEAAYKSALDRTDMTDQEKQDAWRKAELNIESAVMEDENADGS